MGTATVTLHAARPFITLCDLSLTQPQAVNPPRRSSAAAGPDQIELCCAATLVMPTVHIRTDTDTSGPSPAAAGTGTGPWEVVLDDMVTFSTGELALIATEGDSVRIPEVAVTPGPHRVVIATRGGVEAADLEEARIDRVNDGLPDTGLARGPEEWIIDIHP